MSQDSTIEWTDATWNPVRGCTKVSPGCAHCYAETFAERWRGIKGHPYEQGFDLRLVPEKLTEPLSWKKPRRVFVNSMSDLFQEGVPFDFIDKAFAVMACAHKHTFQILTKRPERMLAYMESRATKAQYWKDAAREFGWALEWEGLSLVHFPLPNVWLGVSVENQRFADERIPLLLQTPATIRFLSCEPLLEGLDLGKHRPGALGLHWVIVGGESGPKARKCEPWWIRNIVGQCRDADISVFVKQLGGNPQGIALKSRKGGDMAEWPEDLRIRQFPVVGSHGTQSVSEASTSATSEAP